MIKPMLAVPMAKGTINDWNDWVIDQKFDGHRLIVEVTHSTVNAWTRPRKHAGSDGKTMASKTLPPHLTADFLNMPPGIYDGELIGGATSTDVTRTDLAHTLQFVAFDYLGESESVSYVKRSYDVRRRALVELFDGATSCGSIILAQSAPLRCESDVALFVEHIWAQGGEGAILKRRAAPYQPGKRSPDFIKVKKLQTVVCTVVGFEASKGTVLNRGAFATVLLEDAQGNKTSVKTKDDFELNRFNRAWETVTVHNKDRWSPDSLRDTSTHPALGRKLRIEFQDFMPKAGYRHPRWDRWENE